MRLLICEDDSDITRHLMEILTHQDYDIVFIQDIEQLDKQLQSKVWIPEVVVLDRLFGNDDLVSYLEPMKEKWPRTKILILSAIDTPLEKANAIERGADDYLAKPFTKEELSARIRALYRRVEAVPTEIVIQEVRFNTEERLLKYKDWSLELSIKETELLKLFFLSPGKVFSKEDLVQKVWKSSVLETNTVESTIVRIRRRIEELHAPIQIKNRRFVGYWLEV